MMNEYVQKALQYWVQLRPREQLLLSIGGVVVAVLLLYSILWKPFAENVDRLSREVKEQQNLVVWMNNAASEVRQLKRTQPAGRTSDQGQSLLALIDSSAKLAKLDQALKRVEPESTDKVRVWMENAVFDDVTRWLFRLTSNYGISIDSAVIDKEAGSGRVSARFVFQEGA